MITGGLQGIGLWSLIIRWLNQRSVLAMHLNWKWPFCNIGAWFDQIFRQIVPLTEKTLKNANLVVSRHIKRENASLPVDVRRYYLLHRHFATGDEAQGTMGRRKTRVSPVLSFPPSFARKFDRERDGWVRGRIW